MFIIGEAPAVVKQPHGGAQSPLLFIVILNETKDFKNLKEDPSGAAPRMAKIAFNNKPSQDRSAIYRLEAAACKQ